MQAGSQVRKLGLPLSDFIPPASQQFRPLVFATFTGGDRSKERALGYSFEYVEVTESARAHSYIFR